MSNAKRYILSLCAAVLISLFALPLQSYASEYSPAPAQGYGWYEANGKAYYVYENGSYATGWANLNGTIYYFDTDGSCYQNRFYSENGETYYFASSGALCTGWFQVYGSWYFAGDDGKLYCNRWLNNGGTWYYFDENGVQLTNAYIVSKSGVYCFDAYGALRTGWMKSGNAYYYADGDGKLYRNMPISYNGSVYYFGSNCKATYTRNWVYYNGSWYYRYSNGSYATGITYIEGSPYAFRSNGSAYSGWCKSKGTWYYLYPDGRVARNEWVEYNNKWYYFNAQGRPVTGWKKVSGTYYYFDSDATLVQDDWVAYGSTYYRADSEGRISSNIPAVEVISRDVSTPLGVVKGQLICPRGMGSVPTIIFSHGLGAHGSEFLKEALELAGTGIATYIFDFIGGSEDSASGGSFQQMSVETERVQLDAILTQALTWGEVDSQRTYLGGHSQGGLLSCMLASSRNDVAGIILFAPALNLGEMVRSTCTSLDNVADTFTFLTKKLGRVYAVDLWNMNEAYIEAAYTGTSIIFHGEGDTIIDPQVAVRAKQTWGSACILNLWANQTHFSVISRNAVITKQIYSYVMMNSA